MDIVDQESDIINKNDLEHIIADLSEDSENLNIFLQDDYIEINKMCDSIQGAKLETTDSAVVDGKTDTNNELTSTQYNTLTTIQSATSKQPSTTNYPGPYGFDMSLAGSAYKRGSWIYSNKLKKVFIDMDKVLLIKFKLNGMGQLSTPKDLRVRALPVYTSADHLTRAVKRCTLHLHNSDPKHQAHSRQGQCTCQLYDLVGHVLTTDNTDAIYEYNPESERHSVVIPLGIPQQGSDTFTASYRFACKTSCPGGMSRRPVDIVFTLETPNGDIYGRCSISVKVCSCPKRDKEREENDSYQLSATTGYRVTRGHSRKRIKLEQSQDSFSIKVKDLRTIMQQNFSTLTEMLSSMQQTLHEIHSALWNNLVYKNIGN